MQWAQIRTAETSRAPLARPAHIASQTLPTHEHSPRSKRAHREEFETMMTPFNTVGTAYVLAAVTVGLLAMVV